MSALRSLLALSLSTLLISAHAEVAAPAWQPLTYAPAPADNPLKGLVPYAGAANPDNFPASMEFSYFPLSAVLQTEDRYDWRALERFLDAAAARGRQAVFRFYVEYPGKSGSIPPFLLDAGLAITRYSRPSTPPRPPVDNETPDYSNPALRAAMVKFIHALGARYDGDARIGFITAGLLGMWGEWHDSPRNELFASKAVQQEIMAAYAASFRITPILLRYPAGATHPVYADNAQARFGYHDDSFAWGTLGSKDWHFMNLTRAAGAAALQKWQTQPIGGEIRPEAWGKVFDAEPGNAAIEDFRAGVDATHVSWLMDSGMFRPGNPEARRQRALEEVRHMGYEFQVTQVALRPADAQLAVALQISNLGVAPFYYAWPIEVALLGADGQLVGPRGAAGSLLAILPGTPATREAQLDTRTLAAGRYRVLLRVANPLALGKPLRFANQAQDQDLPGWLSLGSVEIGQRGR